MPSPSDHPLTHRFPALSRQRGEAYFDSGRVSIREYDGAKVDAQVRGTDTYRVSVSWIGPDESNVLLDCSCPDYRKQGPCKHLWAVLLAVEARGGARGLKSGGSVFSRGRLQSRGRDTRPKGRLQKGTLHWAKRVADMREAVAGAKPASEGVPLAGLPVDGIEYLYELDVERALRHGALIVDVLQRQRRKDGSWGVPKEFLLERGGTQPGASELDEQIFAKLLGASTPTDLFEWQPAPRGSSFVLAGSMSEEVLPLLAETRQLHWRAGEREGDAAPLRWDRGEPWRFETRLRQDPRELLLIGELVRGEERRSLEDPVLLVADGFVVFPEEVAAFDARGAMALVVQLRTHGPLRARPDEREELEKALRSFPGGLWRSLPWLAPPEKIAPIPQLIIEGGLGTGPKTTRVVCSAEFLYDGMKIAPDDPREVLTTPDERAIQRDLEAERRAYELLVDSGLRLELGEKDQVGTLELGEVPLLVDTLLGEGWSIYADDAAMRAPGQSSMAVSSGVDWFELDGGLKFGDEVAAFPELLRAAREGRNTVKLEDGSFGVLPKNWVKNWSLLELGDGEDGTLRFPKQQGWILDALLAEREDVTVDADFERYRTGLRKFQGLQAEQEPETFKGTLRDYQRDGLGCFRFWRELGLGGCLADDMGLGKTVQVLAMLEAERGAHLRGEIDAKRLPSLVVAPRSVIFNWVDEATRFTPDLKVVDYTGKERRELAGELDEADLIVTTYGTLRRDAAELSKREFEYAVLDEAQAIKNASSQTAKAARLLTARNRVALSGTPVENHLGELWSLFEFLNPGMLGRASRFQKIIDGSDPEGGRLAQAMRPFFLRRTKEQVLDDLPEKTEQILHCDLGEVERRRYDELKQHYRTELLGRADTVGMNRMKIHVLEALLRLRQCACHPGLMAPEKSGESSAKFDALLPRLEETASEGHKALVFSQFTKLLGILREKLDALGIPYEYLDGRTRNRKERVERFQNDPDCPLFLISLKAGGQGLNLTAADNVFLLDPWWNPAVEAQAIDRAHRIGRRRPVFAYRMIARDTVEERVVELQNKKRALAEALFEGKGGALRDLTREDLEGLLA